MGTLTEVVGERLLAHPTPALRLTAAIPDRTSWQARQRHGLRRGHSRRLPRACRRACWPVLRANSQFAIRRRIGEAPVEIRRYACPRCGGVVRVLPQFLARNLWRTWAAARRQGAAEVLAHRGAAMLDRGLTAAAASSDLMTSDARDVILRVSRSRG